ncbi:MAG: hypothetical protein K9H58_17300 [Bacteroidales bacterium]|nr:hypothetical protein [Bacteroidales bacterium]
MYKNILSNWLRSLSHHSPDEKVWEAISSELDKKTGIKLKSKLSQLSPPKALWNLIDAELAKREKINRLSQYDPPDSVWDNIDQKLNQKVRKPSPSKLIRFVKWTSTAAAMLLIGMLIYFLQNNSDNNLNYSEQWVELNNTQQWVEEDADFAGVLKLLCNEKPQICSMDEFKKMEEELNFLEKSKKDILSHMNKYNTNSDLEKTLVEIELERTNLIKELITKTI